MCILTYFKPLPPSHCTAIKVWDRIISPQCAVTVVTCCPQLSSLWSWSCRSSMQQVQRKNCQSEVNFNSLYLNITACIYRTMCCLWWAGESEVSLVLWADWQQEGDWITQERPTILEKWDTEHLEKISSQQRFVQEFWQKVWIVIRKR